jgi:rubrerythrin
MTLEEAIRTAILFERKVHGSYATAAKRAVDGTARGVFAKLAEEELGHVAYLESRLDEWQREGRLDAAQLATVLPSKERIAAGLKRLRDRPAASGAPEAELPALRQALHLEEEATAFYRQMVQELAAPGPELFSRFLAIEEGHTTLVQAEIDSVTHMGFWFDLKEFDLEAE